MTAAEIVRAITKQNWKLGGALEMDVPEAEALVEQAIAQAREEAIEECAKVAETEHQSYVGDAPMRARSVGMNIAIAIRSLGAQG